MDIPFQGSYDQALLLRAALLANRPTRGWALLRWGLLLVFVPLYAVLLAGVLREPNALPVEWARLARHTFTLAAVIALVGYPYLSAYRLSRQLRQSPSLRAPQVGAVSSQGIRFGADLNRGLIAWDRFAHLRQTPDLVVLVTADGTMAALPRRFFADEEAWRRFRQWVAQRVMVAR